MSDALPWIVAGLVLLLLFYASVRVVPEYERGVVFRLGRVIGAKGPGLFFIIPIVDRMVRVSLRTVTMDIPLQDVIPRDGEFEAAADLGRAAEVLEAHPAAMQLRVLATMNEVAAEKNSTLIFPLPIELMRLVDTLRASIDRPSG